MPQENRLKHRTLGQAVDQAVRRSLARAESLIVEDGQLPLFPNDLEHLRVTVEGLEGAKSCSIVVEFVVASNPWEFVWHWQNARWRENYPFGALEL